MSKIHPTENQIRTGVGEHGQGKGNGGPAVWTVWKKSSMAFHGTDGFSVFDGNGRLAFRVDNYSRRNRYVDGEILLMDGDGRPLVNMKPQFFSMHDRWNGFSCEEIGSGSSAGHIFSMRRTLFRRSNEVEVFMGGVINKSSVADFWSDGCFTGRCCKIWTSKGEVAALITRKKVNDMVILDDDVFSLAVNPGFDSELMMAFVVIMDRICHKPSRTHLLCSSLVDQLHIFKVGGMS